ncbi:unnamed protein product [Prorocentrum cordatum]|uniref:Uncharacterized protein n=1 Tax=Prorocentrum cordatum TaxID=2364126 RepID=A0ABN9T9W4_9DINO|nr:unnamed protein product [Polarella glacialis]
MRADLRGSLVWSKRWAPAPDLDLMGAEFRGFPVFLPFLPDFLFPHFILIPLIAKEVREVSSEARTGAHKAATDCLGQCAPDRNYSYTLVALLGSVDGRKSHSLPKQNGC